MHVFPIGEELKVSTVNQLGPDPFDENYTLDYVKEKLKRTTSKYKSDSTGSINHCWAW